MAKWFNYLKETPMWQIRADVKEYKNLKNNIAYTQVAMDAVYDNLIIRYDKDFEYLLLEKEACIKHRYTFDENTEKVNVRPSVCRYFNNGDFVCGEYDCDCREHNYMYCALKEHLATLQAERDSFWKDKFNQKSK